MSDNITEFKPLGVKTDHFHQKLRLIQEARGYTQAELVKPVSGKSIAWSKQGDVTALPWWHAYFVNIFG